MNTIAVISTLITSRAAVYAFVRACEKNVRLTSQASEVANSVRKALVAP
jgi:hypothetical protein